MKIQRILPEPTFAGSCASIVFSLRTSNSICLFNTFHFCTFYMRIVQFTLAASMLAILWKLEKQVHHLGGTWNPIGSKNKSILLATGYFFHIKDFYPGQGLFFRFFIKILFFQAKDCAANDGDGRTAVRNGLQQLLCHVITKLQSPDVTESEIMWQNVTYCHIMWCIVKRPGKKSDMAAKLWPQYIEGCQLIWW